MTSQRIVLLHEYAIAGHAQAQSTSINTGHGIRDYMYIVYSKILYINIHVIPLTFNRSLLQIQSMAITKL